MRAARQASDVHHIKWKVLGGDRCTMSAHALTTFYTLRRFFSESPALDSAIASDTVET